MSKHPAPARHKKIIRAFPAPLAIILLALSLISVPAGAAINPADYKETIRVACVGDSITYGAGVEDRNNNSYPKVLGKLLGEKFEVRNFGVNGATLLKNGDKPYWKQKAFKAATEFNPHVVIIKLGTNDTKPKNWEHKGEFASDLKAMIDHFQALPAKPKIFLCNPVPAFPERWGIDDTRIREGVIPIVNKVARENKLPTIDLYTPFIGRAKLVPDKIHPNAAGAALMTRIIATRLIDANMPADYHAVYIQNFYDPESMSEFQFTDKKIWKIEKQQRENAAPQAYLEHFARAKYKYKVRSPYNISLIATQKFGSFILDVDMLQTGKNYGHRDMCIFYNFQNRSQFYYTHIAATTDPHAHNIFIVNEKPRTSISKTTTKGHDWGSKQWHHVRLIRDIESGKIEIYVNDMSKPIMTANDKTFGLGHVGFGSFDDTGRVTNIRIWAKKVNPVKGAGKLFED